MPGPASGFLANQWELEVWVCSLQADIVGLARSN